MPITMAHDAAVASEHARKIEEQYQQRLKRYVTAMRNGKPDMVPIRPFVAEFTAKYAGFTCQEVTHDYEKAFEAARKCAADFDWDAVVAQHGVRVDRPDPGDRPALLRACPASICRRTPASSTREPPEEHAFMKRGRVRRADRRPDRVPVQRLAAAGLRATSWRRAARHLLATISRCSRAAWRCCSTSRPSARRSSGCGRNAARCRRSPGSSRRRSTSWPTSCAATSG